jgi:hypothetical protein
MLRRGLVALAVSLLALLGGAVTTSAAANAQTQAASCWVNVFAWVSTFPGVQGNLSSTVSCNVQVQKITLTMLVHNVSNGAVVATVGPQDTWNTMSAGIKYAWYCNSSFPQNLYGEVRGTVTEYGGAVSNGTWGTQSLSC